jgi:hypothetical protein
MQDVSAVDRDTELSVVAISYRGELTSGWAMRIIKSGSGGGIQHVVVIKDAVENSSYAWTEDLYICRIISGSEKRGSQDTIPAPKQASVLDKTFI